MALDTDLSLAPYFDDFTANANQYAVLYRPGVPVQAREMNETQSILQDQIDKFGRSIYKEGSVVEGCAFTFDNKYAYVKIADTYANGTAFTIDDFIGRVVYNSTGLKATIVDAVAGFESQIPDLNTLYIKYLNAGTYSNGASQLAYSNAENLVIATTANVSIGNVTVATVANSAGFGYAMTVTDGVIFKKGYFIRVPKQTALVTKYSNQPNNVSVGFGVIEDIETPASNTFLYDNAQGAPNFGAPGAHRLKLTPNLITKNTSDISNTSTFFSIADFQGGKPVTIKNDPQYSALGTQLARRTFETNGDFVVNPFLLTTETKKANNDTANTAANTEYLSLVSSPGIAYAKGYRVEFLNRNSVDLRKGSNTLSYTSRVSANFGYYVYANQFVGDFNFDNLAQVELHSVAYSAVSNGTFLSTSRDASKKIGTAYIRGVEYFSGTPGSDAQYIVYLFNISMSPGASFSQVKSVLYYDSTVKAVADVVLTYDAGSSSNVAQLQEIFINTMIFPFGQKAVVANSTSFQNTSYTYRRRSNTQIDGTSGNMTVSLSGSGETFTYGTGSLSQEQMQTFVVMPNADIYSQNNSGTVTTSGNTLTSTNTTAFTVYRVGDIIRVANTTNNNERVITSITNATYLSVNAAFSPAFSGVNHQLKFASGQPISFLNRSGRSITISANTTQANISLGISTNTSSAGTMTVYHDVLKNSAVSIKKAIRRNTLVKIDTATNAGGVTGPWCLGVTDALRINNVWVSTTGSYSNTVTDSVGSFSLDDGQKDAYYGLAYLKTNVTALPAGSKVLVSVDHFTHNQSPGLGFFVADSYPIDDVNGSANASAITTAEIPLFTSPTKGSTFDLRDCVDFRPYVANTATFTDVLASATENPNTTIVFSGATDSSIQTGSYIIAPNQLFETDLSYYLPRRDRVALTTGGQIIITEGLPDVNPRAPAELPGTMSLGIIDVPPYPTLSAVDAKTYNRYDYAPVINLSQIKRYTMADIGTLANRITNLEYYTSLSALEQSAANLLVRSGTTGQNRFKNGILVDPFRGHDIGNTRHPQYSIAVDANRQEARPFFRMWSEDVYIDTTLSTGYTQTGHKITLAFSEAQFQQQPYASKFHNCIEGNVYNWRGSIIMFPSGDTQPDRTVSPDVVNNLDLASNWINLAAQQAWGTSWGNWVTTSSSTEYGSAYQTGASSAATNADGSITTTYYTNINTSTAINQARVGTTSGVTTSNNSLNLGTFVTDISIKPYIKSREVFFAVRGLKPNTIVYPYFNNTRVSNYCKQMYNYTGTVTANNNAYTTSNGQSLFVVSQASFAGNTTAYFTANGNAYGNTSVLRTASDGSMFGLFMIPADTFKTGDVEFRITDITDLVQGEDAITTDASTTYVASGLSVSYGQSTLNTRQAQITQTQVTETQVIQQNGVVAGPPITVYTPAPPPPPVVEWSPAVSWPPPYQYPWEYSWGDGGF